MKQVCVNAATCSVTRRTTSGALLPTLTTAMPLARSISELPSTSTITPPPAAATYTGSTLPTPDATAAPAPLVQLARPGPGDLGDQPALLGQVGPTRRRRLSSVVEPAVSVVMRRSGNGIGGEDNVRFQYPPRRSGVETGSGDLRRGHAPGEHSRVEHGAAPGEPAARRGEWSSSSPNASQGASTAASVAASSSSRATLAVVGEPARLVDPAAVAEPVGTRSELLVAPAPRRPQEPLLARPGPVEQRGLDRVDAL